MNHQLFVLEDNRRHAAREAERAQRLARFGRRLDRIANVFGWATIVFVVGFMAGAIARAFVDGAFQAVTR